MPDAISPISPMPLWKNLLRDNGREGVLPELFFNAASPAAPAFPEGGTLIALAAVPDVLERSFRRGVVLCAAGESFTALLFWRGRVFGVFRHKTAVRGVENIMRDLKEFRLGWLPDEVAKESGGDGTAFAELPPEAEGFPVTCIAGPDACLFADYGKIYEIGRGAVAE